MKGIVCKGESLKIEFDVNQVNYNGKVLTYFVLPNGSVTKEQLVKFLQAGLINKWMQKGSDGYEIEVDTESIEWED